MKDFSETPAATLDVDKPNDDGVPFVDKRDLVGKLFCITAVKFVTTKDGRDTAIMTLYGEIEPCLKSYSKDMKPSFQPVKVWASDAMLAQLRQIDEADYGSLQATLLINQFNAFKLASAKTLEYEPEL